MKLSKQERIGLMIIIAVVILALGAFLMVKPKIEEMNRNKETMETKQKDYDEKKAKADTKDDLRKQIEAAYEKGEDTADMFFSEMDGYEVDDMFREFLENREYTKPGANKPEDKANILVEELQISTLSTDTLSPSFLEIRPISYPLKQFATQGGVTLSKEEQAEQLRKAALQAALGGDQTIGATTISFTAKSLSNDDLIKFADEINNFVREENGNVVRKAMKTQNIELTYNDITRKYDEMVEDILEEAEANGKAAFEHDFPGALSGGSSSSGSNVMTPNPDAAGNNNNNKGDVSDYLCSWENTLTLYSVERMQNPKPILDEQDGISSSEE